MKKIILIIVISICIIPARAQLYELSGQNPQRIKWYEINNDTFRIIFPAGSEKVAQKTLNTLDKIDAPVSQSLHVRPRPISIIIQSQNTDNNGFVTSGSRRAEFFVTPPQNPYGLGLNDWMEELCVHEFRHVVQMDKAKQGWGKKLYYLFGNTGLSMAEGITNPWWFWEGDAVGCETVFGYGGRGRMPSFDLAFRMRLLSGKSFPYNKAVCGSMKNFVPNHYVLGYFMTTYLKNKFGASVWDTILNKVYNTAPLPFSFSRSVKAVTGLSVKDVYKAMSADIKKQWEEQLAAIIETPASYVYHKNNKVFTNYRFPCYLPDGSIVALKSGLADGGLVSYKSSIQDVSKLVLLGKEGTEKVLLTTGILDDNGRISSSGYEVVWSEFNYDPRWGARTYSVIKMYNARTGKFRQITHKTRLHAPTLSPDGTTLAAIEYTSSSECFLALVNVADGKITRRFNNPENLLYMQPQFAPDGASVILLRSRHGEKGIIKIDIQSGEQTDLLPWITENIATPTSWKHYILYNSPQSGIDNIYALDTITAQMYQVTSRKYGAFHPTISSDGLHLAFHDFTPVGACVAVMPLDTTLWTQVNGPLTDKKVEYYKPYLPQEAGNILTDIPAKKFEVRRHNRWRNLINLYGWGYQPLSNTPDIRFGANSQSLLSTFTLDAGIGYDLNERKFGKYLIAKYMGFYPVVTFSYNDSKRGNLYTFNGFKDVVNPAGKSYNYQTTDLTVSLPLNYTNGRFIRKMNLAASAFLTRISTADIFFSDWDELPKTGFFGLKYIYSYSVQLRQNIRDVAPRLGYAVDAIYTHTPSKTGITGEQFAGNIQCYLPGLFKHHAIRVRGMYQQNAMDGFFFKNAYIFVRGETNAFAGKLAIGTFEYKFPLAFPDFSIGGYLYIQRVKTNLFTDIGWGQTPVSNTQPLTQQYQTIGIEQTFDLNFLRFLVPLNVGIRCSYNVYTQHFRNEFMLSVLPF